jgi:hypothetical protein
MPTISTIYHHYISLLIDVVLVSSCEYVTIMGILWVNELYHIPILLRILFGKMDRSNEMINNISPVIVNEVP